MQEMLHPLLPFLWRWRLPARQYASSQHTGVCIRLLCYCSVKLLSLLVQAYECMMFLKVYILEAISFRQITWADASWHSKHVCLLMFQVQPFSNCRLLRRGVATGGRGVRTPHYFGEGGLTPSLFATTWFQKYYKCKTRCLPDWKGGLG